MLTENYVKAGNVMENKYSRLQISIHWLVFLLVIAAYCAMEFRGFFPRSDRPLINMVHVSCGISILVLMVVRLLLRLKYPTPPIIQAKTDDDGTGAFGTFGDLSPVYCAASDWFGDDV